MGGVHHFELVSTSFCVLLVWIAIYYQRLGGMLEIPQEPAARPRKVISQRRLTTFGDLVFIALGSATVCLAVLFFRGVLLSDFGSARDKLLAVLILSLALVGMFLIGHGVLRRQTKGLDLSRTGLTLIFFGPIGVLLGMFGVMMLYAALNG